MRQLALTAGIAGNLAILVFYKYADFLAGNLNVVLAPLGAGRIPLLHMALPIGVSFVVFEKITYLVDTYRGTSRPPRRSRTTACSCCSFRNCWQDRSSIS